MKKLLLLALLAMSASSANLSVKFKESRYLKAFDEMVSRTGEIKISGNVTSIAYKGGQKITSSGGNITIEEGGKTTVKKEREDPNLMGMFRLFRAMFEGDERGIAQIFKINRVSEAETELEAKNSASPIVRLTYWRKNGNVTKLEMFTTTDERIVVDVVETR
jgi:hypothetical protein